MRSATTERVKALLALACGNMNKFVLALGKKLYEDTEKGTKRQCVELGNSPSTRPDIDEQAEALMKNESLPLHSRTLLSCLLEDRKRFQVLIDLCKELTEEVKILRAENSVLKS
ncbi:hypothetical protein Aduo_016035 [Ancylostoma duodenale]